MAPYFSTHLNAGAGAVLVAVDVADVVGVDDPVVVRVLDTDVVWVDDCDVVAVLVADVVAVDVTEVVWEVVADVVPVVVWVVLVVGVVVVVAVVVVVGEVVALVVGVVTWQSANPPLIQASAMRLSVLAVLLHPVGSYSSVPNAQPTSYVSSAEFAAADRGPRNSRTTALMVAAVAAQPPPLSSRPCCPSELVSHSSDTSP